MGLRAGTIFTRAVLATLGVLVTLFGAFLLHELRDLLIVAVIALIFASAIAPLVARVNRRLPLAVSIGLVYLGLLLIFAALLALIVGPLVGEARVLAREAPQLLEQAQARIAELQRSLGLPADALTPNLRGNYSRLTENAPALAAGVLDVTLGFVTGVAGIVIVLVLAFYWLLERRDVESTWLALVPRDGRGRVREVIEEVEGRLGGYVRGQLALTVIIGVFSWAGLAALGIPFALVLALVAGLGELIPYAGPILAAVPAVLVAITVSPARALLVVGLYVVIQQLENHVFVPMVMRRAVGLSPLTVVLAIFAGTALLGFVGVLLAVPLAAVAKVLLDRTLFRRHEVQEAHA